MSYDSEQNNGHRNLVRAIDQWVINLGPESTDSAPQIAVDLADILRASDKVRALVGELIAIRLSGPQGAGRALEVAGFIEVQLFTELKGHLENLEVLWPDILERLDTRAS